MFEKRLQIKSVFFFFYFSIIFIFAIAHKVYRLKIDDGRKKKEEKKACELRFPP